MFTIIGLAVALIFWFFDSTVHYYVYGEPDFEIIPEDFNELWMRIVIILLLMSFGIFVDYFSKKLVIKEKELQSARIYNSMIYATHHILNNLLNQMQLVKMEAQKSKDFNQDMIKYYDNAIHEATDLIKKLSSVEQITDENIWASVDPNNIDILSDKTNSDDTKNRAAE
ncbi:MAG: hypothetical protein WBF77_11295 [Sulfurimonadaceae bacterium]